MADQWIATTNIKYGKKDGAVENFQEGAPVALPQEDLDKLIEAGSVVRESELEYMKMHLPGGVSNSFNPDDLPDTPAGKAVREALDDLRKEQQDAEAKAAKERMDAAERERKQQEAPGDDGDTTAGAGEKKDEAGSTSSATASSVKTAPTKK
jgi:hypothetical protein